LDLKVHFLETAHWLERILDQEGVPFETDKLSNLQSSNPGVVATASGFISNVPAKLIITNHKALSRVLGRKVKSFRAAEFSYSGKRGHAYLSIFSANLDKLASYQEMGHHFDRFGKRIPFSGIVLGELEGKLYLSLPWNMVRFPSHWSRWSLYLTRSRHNDRLFCETVPLVDDRLVREAVFETLVVGYQAINAPVVRIAPRLAGPGYITIRIDADGYSEQSTEKVNRLARRLNIPFSWFIDTWSWKKKSAEIKELAQSNEIGLHSYFHATSVWRNSNLRNLKKGFRFLEDQGVAKCGFVSPFGHWNRRLGEAMAKEEISYSSEFAFSCDIFPSKSEARSQRRPLQIPTIPISLGVWTGSKNYWDVLLEEVDLRLKKSGFAVIYDHPLGRLENQVEKMGMFIEELTARGHVFVTMSQLHQFLSTKPRLQSVNWDGQKVNYKIEGREGLHFSVEVLWKEPLFAGQNQVSLNSGIGRQNSFSIAWGKTVFFGLFATVPIGWHICWAKLRGLPKVVFEFAALNRLKA
jgi:peptidoglycan/xylan/chitin deacetylase (PgdA/CDA1 family)